MSMVPPVINLPLTPLPNTADPNPLVSVQQYQDITGDTASDTADVSEVLTDAIDLVCQECTRTLLYGQYEEVQYLYANGMVYPSAVPIDPTQQISSNQVIYDPATDAHPASIIQGWGVWVGWFTPLPWMPVFTGVLAPQTQIIYWGGYTQSTLPPKLRRLIAKIAYRMLIANNDTLSGMPGGVRSLSVNGISVSGNSLSGFMVIDSTTKKELRRFKRPQVEAWQT